MIKSDSRYQLLVVLLYTDGAQVKLEGRIISCYNIVENWIRTSSIWFGDNDRIWFGVVGVYAVFDSICRAQYTQYTLSTIHPTEFMYSAQNWKIIRSISVIYYVSVMNEDQNIVRGKVRNSATNGKRYENTAVLIIHVFS